MASSGAPLGNGVLTRTAQLAGRAAAAVLDRRRLAAGVVLGVWVLVVAWSTGAAPASGSWLGLPNVGDILAGVVLVAAVLGLVLFIALLVSGRRSDGDLPARKPLWPSLVVGFLLLLVITRLPRSEEADRARSAPEPLDEVETPVSLTNDVIGRDELAAVALLVILSAAVMIWTRRRMAVVVEPEIAAMELDDRIEPILAEAVASLRLGTDPRSAVLGSYAALETGFAELGWRRGHTETPTEFVARALARFPAAAAPVGELAHLYELARFSARPIGTADQRRATMSLDAALARLATDRIDRTEVWHP